MFENLLKLITNTEPIDRDKAATAMKEFYEYCGQEEPEIVFVNGPKDLEEKLDLTLEGFSFFDHKDITQFVTKRGTRDYDCIKHDIVSLFWKHRSPKKMKKGFVGSSAILEPQDYEYYNSRFEEIGGGYHYKWNKFATAVWDNSLLTLNYKGKSYMLERPEVIKWNDRGLHCDDGPALVFRDGSEFYFWNSERMTKHQFENPHRITLEEIHSKHYKHIWIAFIGVDRYMKMVEEWKPNVKGKFQKFFDFAKMIHPADSLPRDPRKYYSHKGKGWMYEDKPEDVKEWQKHKPYKVKFSKATVNGKHGTLVDCENYSTMHLLPDYYGAWGKHWLDSKQGRKLFEETDRELLDLLLINEQMSKGGYHLEITYLNKEFKMTLPRSERLIHGNCHGNMAPAWFKAKMFLGEDVEYKGDRYAIRWSKEKGLEYAGDEEILKSAERFPLYNDEDVPWVYFDVEITSDSWEGLLEKWARLAFEWIQMQ